MSLGVLLPHQPLVIPERHLRKYRLLDMPGITNTKVPEGALPYRNTSKIEKNKGKYFF